MGTHILGASRGGPCDSTALVDYRILDLPLYRLAFVKHFRMSNPKINSYLLRSCDPGNQSHLLIDDHLHDLCLDYS